MAVSFDSFGTLVAADRPHAADAGATASLLDGVDDLPARLRACR